MQKPLPRYSTNKPSIKSGGRWPFRLAMATFSIILAAIAVISGIHTQKASVIRFNASTSRLELALVSSPSTTSLRYPYYSTTAPTSSSYGFYRSSTTTRPPLPHFSFQGTVASLSLSGTYPNFSLRTMTGGTVTIYISPKTHFFISKAQPTTLADLTLGARVYVGGVEVFDTYQAVNIFIPPFKTSSGKKFASNGSQLLKKRPPKFDKHGKLINQQRTHLSRRFNRANSSRAGLGLRLISDRVNGKTVSIGKVRQAIAHGKFGPLMPYLRGFGLGRRGGPPGLIPLASSVPSPTEAIQTISATAKTNSILTIALLLLLGLPAILFNSALETHHDRLIASDTRLRKTLRSIGSWFDRLHGALLLGVFGLIGAVLYTLDDPTFGLNLSSLAEIIGYFGAIIITAFVTEIARGFYVRHKFQKVGRLKAFPLGILIALVFVIFSRLSHFEPGYVFGILISLVFIVEPTGEENGKSLALSSIWLFLLATVAWFVWIPVKSLVIGGNQSFILLVVDSLLSYIWICGLQSLFFGLIPARYMKGEVIFSWSKTIWLVMFASVGFIFVQFIVHPSLAGYGGNKNASLLPMMAIFLLSAIGALSFWLYTHFKYGTEVKSGQVALRND